MRQKNLLLNLLEPICVLCRHRSFVVCIEIIIISIYLKVKQNNIVWYAHIPMCAFIVCITFRTFSVCSSSKKTKVHTRARSLMNLSHHTRGVFTHLHFTLAPLAQTVSEAILNVQRQSNSLCQWHAKNKYFEQIKHAQNAACAVSIRKCLNWMCVWYFHGGQQL